MAKAGKRTTVVQQNPAVARELTGPQLVTVGLWADILPIRRGVTYETYRTIRRHPTVALARAYAVAPIVAANWSIEMDDDAEDDWMRLVQDEVVSRREQLLQTIMENLCDYGWSPWEQVYEADESGRIVLRKLKPLLVDITQVVIDPQTGDFRGFEQNGYTAQLVRIPLEKALHVSCRQEGSNWYGEPLLEAARAAHDNWVSVNTVADRYDRKVAGSHWIIKYPLGTSTVDGEQVDNGEVAKRIGQALQASGMVTVPASVSTELRKLNDQSAGTGVSEWSVDLISDEGSRQATFVDRLAYLDKLMARALLIPERSVFEGEFGTKAEAGVHANVAITIRENEHRHATRLINEQVVDRLLEFNYGREARGKVRLVAAPLVDELRALLERIYLAILQNPSGFVEEFGTIDTDAIKDKLSVPKAAEIAQAGEVPREVPLIPPALEDQNPLAASLGRLYRSVNRSMNHVATG